MAEIKNLQGLVFGNLTVLSLASNRNKNNRVRWNCICKCGNTFIALSDKLGGGRAKSCGCRGAIKTPGKSSWRSMISRCTKPNTHAYDKYGGAGITVCNEWLTFEGFLKDMGERPSKIHSIDRYPNKKGNYEPSNCRWATPKQQANNLINNVWVEFNGEKLLIPDWAKRTGLSQQRIRRRLDMGDTVEQALRPAKKYNYTNSKEERYKTRNKIYRMANY